MGDLVLAPPEFVRPTAYPGPMVSAAESARMGVLAGSAAERQAQRDYPALLDPAGLQVDGWPVDPAALVRCRVLALTAVRSCGVAGGPG